MGMKEVNKFKQPLGGDNVHCIHVVWQPPPIGCLTNTSLTTVATNERSHLLALFRTGHGRSYLYVLGINYKRPGGWEEFEQAQKDGTGVKPARYNQPAGEEERDDQANKPSMKYTVSCTGNA